MEEQKYLYIAFVSSPYLTGKIIRKFTKYPYNHMEIGFSSDLDYFWSFSRRYKKAPFYAGFTPESAKRFLNRGKYADIKICAVPVSSEQFLLAKKETEYLYEHREEYIYNLIGAFGYNFGKFIRIEKSAICVEFVLSMLKKHGGISVLNEKDFFSIKELSSILDEYKIYEGSGEKFYKTAEWKEDEFPKEKSGFFYMKNTIKTNAELIKRFLKSALKER